jgi:hypothetical protein
MKINRTTLRDRCRMAMAGIDKYLASEVTIPLDGSAKAPADVKKALQSSIDAADATQTARAVWIDSSAAEQNLHDSTVSMLASLRSFVLLKFGSNALATLADFGFKPRKQTVPVVETKAAAAVKSLATRAARHTMGPKQKKAITGASVTATATAPAPAAGSASPPAASPNGPAAPAPSPVKPVTAA